jgi:hypothetical protein
MENWQTLSLRAYVNLRNNLLSSQFHLHTNHQGIGMQTEPQEPWNQFCVDCVTLLKSYNSIPIMNAISLRNSRQGE